MNRRSVRSAVVAAGGVLAVALAAATLPSAIQPEAGGGAEAGGGGGGLRPPPSEGPSMALPRLPYFEEAVALLFGLVILAGLAYIVLYRRETLWMVLGVGLAVGLLVFVLQVLASLLEGGVGGLFGGGGGFSGAGEATGAAPALPSALLLLLVVVAVGGVLAVFLGGGGEEDTPDEAEEEAADPEAVGQAAGDAADRIEAETGPPAENEVYRAWLEMTDLLAVEDPETTTPGEFERAAVEAGLAREDVRELRRLFEDARYGGATPGEDEERRAVSTFRRIERAYAGAGS